MADPRELRTRFSMQALDMSELFRGHFATRELGSGAAAYNAELTAPEGPSTGGGAQAVQHIRLLPKGGVTAARPIVNAGTVVQTSYSAELRSYAHVAQIFAARVGGVPPFDAPAFDALFADVRKFLAEQGFQVTNEALPTAAAVAGQSPATATGGGNPWKIVAILALLGLAAVIAVLLVRR